MCVLNLVADIRAAHLLQHADHIIALDTNGQVVKQGPPDRDGNQKLVVSYLEGVEVIDEEVSLNSKEKNCSGFEPVNASSPNLQGSVDAETQRLGDRQVYKYYFSTFGLPKTMVFFALQIVLVFCLKFPGGTAR